MQIVTYPIILLTLGVCLEIDDHFLAPRMECPIDGGSRACTGTEVSGSWDLPVGNRCSAGRLHCTGILFGPSLPVGSAPSSTCRLQTCDEGRSMAAKLAAARLVRSTGSVLMDIGRSAGTRSCLAEPIVSVAPDFVRATNCISTGKKLQPL